MASLENAIAYLTMNYPHKDELSNARVTKMLYLADWYGLINKQGRVTNIKWYYDNYGPFVWDVRKAVIASRVLKAESTHTMFGDPKEVFELEDRTFKPKLAPDEQEALDHVIEQTKRLSWSSFIQLVYSTYPVASSAKYSYLNLESLAEEYVRQESSDN